MYIGGLAGSEVRVLPPCGFRGGGWGLTGAYPATLGYICIPRAGTWVSRFPPLFSPHAHPISSGGGTAGPVIRERLTREFYTRTEVASGTVGTSGTVGGSVRVLEPPPPVARE